MCEYPSVCVPLWATIVTPLCGVVVGLLLGLTPYFFLTKKDKLQSSSDISKTINAQFSVYQKLLDEYIKNAKTQKDTPDFIELTKAFEELIASLTDACEKLLHNALPKTAHTKFLPTVKEVCDDNMIQTYYGIVKMKYKKENYQLLYKVYDTYCKNSTNGS